MTVGFNFEFGFRGPGKGFEKNGNEILMYDENGKLIKINGNQLDESEVSIASVKTSSLADVKLKEDAFVKEEETKEVAKLKEAEEAKKNQTEIVSITDNLNKLFGANITPDSFVKQNAEVKDDYTDVIQLAEKLTSVTADNTTVIESLKSFQTKAKDMEAAVIDYQDNVNKEEKEANLFAMDTKQDKYDKNHKIEIEDGVTSLFNNPFYKSAFETTEVEEEEMVLD